MKFPKLFFFFKKVCLKSITRHTNYNSSLSFEARHPLNSLYTARLICRANGICPLPENVISKFVIYMLTDPDTYRARKKRASGPADFPHRGKF